MTKNEIRNRILKQTAILGIAANAMIALVKVVIGFFSGSVAIMSDAANNASDMLSSVVTIVGFNVAKRNPTHSHPLGFGRMEYISALFVAFIVLFTGGSFFRSSVDRILNPSPVSVTVPMLLILLLTIGVKIALWRINIKNGRKIESEALSASGTDALSDALESLSETIERLEDERHDAEEVMLDDLANVYAKLNFAVNTAETGPSAIDTTDHDALVQWPECMPFDREDQLAD